jgi:hypothetical protein
MMKRVALLLAVLACREQTAPSPPPADVAGTWAFAGVMFYGSLSCADTLTMQLTQYGASVSAETSDWHFWCGASPSGTLTLSATGAVRGDSVALRWETLPTFPNCPGCWTFTTVGAVLDSLLRGRYYDFLGGVGTWSAARREP